MTDRAIGSSGTRGNFPRSLSDQDSVENFLSGFSRRAACLSAITMGLVLASAGPAGAHVEASAEGAQAGAGPVTVAVLAEAESTTAGIVGAKTQLPANVLPEWVSLASGPAGWTLAATPDGYEVGGPDIGPGVDLEFSVTIGQLPRDITELPLKTLLRYSDGREDAWIELPTPDNPQPEKPAPIIAVAPAAPEATTTAPSSPAPSTPSAENTTSAEPREDAAQSSTEDGSTSTGWIAAIVVLVAAALAGGLWFWRSRASRGA